MALPASDSSLPNNTEPIVCYAPNMITTNGIWQGDNPLDYSLPLFILQLSMIVILTRILVFILKPLRQPLVISEILGGVILGPSVLGRNAKFADTVFPLRSVMVLETMANIGLLYFLFLIGVEMDITVIKRTGKKALAIAIGGMVLPFTIGASFSLVMHKKDPNMNEATFVLFLGVALSVTAFPVLARILAELKLINTELGRMAMSTALINDITAWVLLALAITLAENHKASAATIWVILSCIGFICVCFFVVRPCLSWVVRKTPEGESFSDLYICLILTGVMVSGFVTDAIGTHSVLGAFVFGLVIPNGPLGVALIEKLEDFVSGLLLPLFFAISGLRTNVKALSGFSTWAFTMLVIVLGCAGKVAGTVLICFFYQMPFYEGVTLGLLLNTKGLVEMIILNVGRDQKVLDDEAFAMMVIVAITMTGIITPLVTAIYKPSRRSIAYKKRTIQRSRPDSELRVLICIHNPRNVPTIINLIEATHPTKKSPICIYVLHLVELSGRASAMLIIHNTRESGKRALNRTQAQSDHIINAFTNYESHANNCVSVQPLTAISPYPTMHEDICNLAEDKRVAFIILPFHKQQTVDGWMEATNPAFRTVNLNVLANAPCSVGILIDRGLNGATRNLASNKMAHHVVLLFFGGPDDREALSYAWRMSEHPGTNLTVMRFVAAEEARRESHSEPEGLLTVETDVEKNLDERCLNEFKMKAAHQESIIYTEIVLNDGDQTVAAIRSIDTAHDLFIVGRGQGVISPLTAGLMDWSECPELGPIGDLLASSDFASNVSVLVVQQYVGIGINGDIVGTPDSPLGKVDHHLQFSKSKP